MTRTICIFVLNAHALVGSWYYGIHGIMAFIPKNVRLELSDSNEAFLGA